jgi:hypothetical protein
MRMIRRGAPANELPAVLAVAAAYDLGRALSLAAPFDYGRRRRGAVR